MTIRVDVDEVSERLGLRLMRKADYGYFGKALHEAQLQMSEYTFSNLCAWNDPWRLLGRYKDHWVCGYEWEEGMIFLQPIGVAPSEVMLDILQEFDVVFEPVNSWIAGKIGKQALVEPLRDHYDYIYSREELVDTVEIGLRSHLRDICKFEKQFQPIVEMITEDNKEECRGVLRRWYESREHNTWMEKEFQAATIALDNYEMWKSFGILVRVEGVTRAYAFGEYRRDEFILQYSKTEGRQRGLAPFTLYQLMLRLRGVRFVNRMQDLGIPGLREAKMSWRPCYFVEKYSVRRLP